MEDLTMTAQIQDVGLGGPARLDLVSGHNNGVGLTFTGWDSQGNERQKEMAFAYTDLDTVITLLAAYRDLFAPADS